ncbi:arylsulfatase [Rhodobacteraceae bacterium NNCM2]|nr:arylsulfatase [Coraliihabitans acroporae]
MRLKYRHGLKAFHHCEIMLAATVAFLATCNSLGAQETAQTGAEATERPNFLLIVLDDVGYTDLGTYGSEIPTPNIDGLAEQGLTLTNFYAAPTCSPTRAMLLTGVDSHLAGLGNMDEFMAENQKDQPGYEGHLNDRVVTVAEVLGASGYRTYMTGKWHLGLGEEQSPWARGFDKSFASLMGGASHFDDMAGPTVEQTRAAYRHDKDLVESLPADFFSTDFYTDEMIGYLEAERETGKPFFAYLAYTAVHFPIQAPDDFIDNFRGEYDAGYEKLREERFERIKSLGYVPADAELPALGRSVPGWESLSDEEKRRQSRVMEVYAAMVDNLDVNIGRVIDYLKETGQYENTYIIIMSDNGPEGNPLQGPMFKEWIDAHDNSFENIGRKGSFVAAGPGWAEASSAPFRAFKSYTSEGGIRVPAIIHYPQNASIRGVSSAVATVRDITPTILDAAHVEHPGTEFEGREVYPPSGRSLVGLLNDQDNTVWAEDEIVAMEIFGRRAMRMGRWKAVLQETPNGTGEWELYDLQNDPGEQTDLAEQNVDTLTRMVALFEAYEQENNLIYPEGPSGY